MNKKTNGVRRQIKVPMEAVIAAKTAQMRSGLNKFQRPRLSELYLLQVKSCANIAGKIEMLRSEKHYQGIYAQIVFDVETYQKIKSIARQNNAPIGRTIASLLAIPIAEDFF